MSDDILALFLSFALQVLQVLGLSGKEPVKKGRVRAVQICAMR